MILVLTLYALVAGVVALVLFGLAVFVGKPTEGRREPPKGPARARRGGRHRLAESWV